VTEEYPLAPESPYGETKLIGEWLVADATRAYDLRSTSLRYFNVAGSGNPELRDSSPHNLFPRIFDALSRGQVPHITGTDYDTPDGTCLRDYVHVVDVANAHVRAARAMMEGESLESVYNLGSGTGFSVREVMDTVARITGIPFTPEVKPRRDGDPSRIVASGSRAARDLGWTHLRDLDAIVSSAWAAARGGSERTDVAN
jgi:UDP-glucose 4-epimerase